MKKGYTFTLSFLKAHFKRHATKKFRSTYISPPPTVIWGMLGAFLGLEREEIEDFVENNELRVGSELLDCRAITNEKATLLKAEKKEKGFVRTPEDFEFLVEPVFRIAIWSKSEFIDEIEKKVRERNPTFDLYGGITDCFLKDMESERHYTELETLKEVRGMVPVKRVKNSLISQGQAGYIQVLYLNEFFYQGFNIIFETKEPVPAIGGIAVWGLEDVRKFRSGTSAKRVTSR